MSYASEQGVLNAQFNIEIIRCLPHVVMRPNLVQDGNAWLAIYGDLPNGVVGTGSTPAEAMADFDSAWTRPAVAPPGYGFAKSEGSSSESQLLELVAQYRSDLLHFPAPDSIERRIKAIDAVIAKAEGRQP